ncbi:hypothetical protein K523DRAFT_411697 [Schizophyllum commune Tattone D]|nr:hypothetical protein K523DRAFT_411697 [Schizophyllum commune Tattone D]
MQQLKTLVLLAPFYLIVPTEAANMCAYTSNTDFDDGAYGLALAQSYDASSYTPAMWNFEVSFDDTSADFVSDGLIFFAPRGTNAKQAEARILNQQSPRRRRHLGQSWDYLHIKSIMNDDCGHHLISSRLCHALYYIGGEGEILWSTGGNKSSFEMSEGTDLYWPHDAMWLKNHHISVFDNGGTGRGDEETSARGIVLELNYQNMKVVLDSEILP